MKKLRRVADGVHSDPGHLHGLSQLVLSSDSYVSPSLCGLVILFTP